MTGSASRSSPSSAFMPGSQSSSTRFRSAWYAPVSAGSMTGRGLAALAGACGGGGGGGGGELLGAGGAHLLFCLQEKKPPPPPGGGGVGKSLIDDAAGP